VRYLVEHAYGLSTGLRDVNVREAVRACADAGRMEETADWIDQARACEAELRRFRELVERSTATRDRG
jgi:hypothetical protein